jgi:hypothetical protein
MRRRFDTAVTTRDASTGTIGSGPEPDRQKGLDMRTHGAVMLALASLLMLAAAGWSAAQSANVGQAAPDVTGGGGWINSSPLTMPALKGRVVLVEFWTYG